MSGVESAPYVPVDDSALCQIEHALDGTYAEGEDGNPELVGAGFTLTQLLDFWSGYDESRGVLKGRSGGVPLYVHPESVLSTTDLINALVAEIRRLRHVDA